MAAQPQDPNDVKGRIKESGLKALEKATAKAVDEKVASGQDPNQVLTDLLGMVSNLANTPTGPIEGSQVGLPGTISGLLSGELVSPFKKREGRLGVDNAFQLVNLQRGLQSDQRQVNQDEFQNALAILSAQIQQNQEQRAQQKAPLELQKLQNDIQLNSPQARQDKIALEDQRRAEDQQNKFFEQISKPLTTTKDLSFTEAAITGIDNISGILGINVDEDGNVSVQNANLLKEKNFLNKHRQELKRARDVFINKALRRDTGAAIGKDEERNFKEVFGFDIGLKSFLQNPEVIAKSLVESQDQLIRDRDRLSPNSEVRKFNQFLIKKGLSTKDRKKVLAESGMLG